MALSGGDKIWIVYQGPPRWDGSEWVNGDRFFLSGHRKYSQNLGIELAKEITGLDREPTEYRVDSSANIAGGKHVDTIAGPRQIDCAVNIMGDNNKQMRENKRRWFRNHPDDNPGRLWAFTSDGPPRYLSVIKSDKAALGSLDEDPSIYGRYKGLEWGWVSNEPYWLGFRETKRFKHVSGGKYKAVFYNPSTVPQVYPVMYLPGPGQWTLSLGYQRLNFRTPVLLDGETARLDFHPKHPTFNKKKPNGEIENLWPSMVGQRPIFSLEAETMNAIEISHSETNGKQWPENNQPRISFTPKYHSWF